MVAVLTDKKTSLHKHKMGARDSMLWYIWYQLFGDESNFICQKFFLFSFIPGPDFLYVVTPQIWKRGFVNKI